MFPPGKDFKVFPVDKLIGILQKLPPGSLAIANNVGNLTIVDEQHNMLGYVDFHWEKYEDGTDEAGDE